MAQNSALLCEVQPHLLAAPPPPQVWLPKQLPQLATLRGLPQLSVPKMEPHVAPMRAQNEASVSAAQAQTPALQALPAAQLPQPAQTSASITT